MPKQFGTYIVTVSKNGRSALKRSTPDPQRPIFGYRVRQDPKHPVVPDPNTHIAPVQQAVNYVLSHFTKVSAQDILDKDYAVSITEDIGNSTITHFFLGVLDDNPYLLSTVPGRAEIPLGSVQVKMLTAMPDWEKLIRSELLLSSKPYIPYPLMVDFLTHLRRKPKVRAGQIQTQVEADLEKSPPVIKDCERMVTERGKSILIKSHNVFLPEGYTKRMYFDAV